MKVAKVLYVVQLSDKISKSILLITRHVTRDAHKFVNGQNTLISIIDVDEINELIQRSVNKYRSC